MCARACVCVCVLARVRSIARAARAALPAAPLGRRGGGRNRGVPGGGGGKGKKDWARAARGAARSPYDGGPRLESNEPSLYEGSDEEL